MENEENLQENETTEVSSEATEVSEQKKTYKVYSEVLHKLFDSVEELETAEAEAKKAEEAKKQAAEKAKAERQADVMKVQDAMNTYLKCAKENQEARDAMKEEEDYLYKAYREELNNFAAKNKNYHLSYTINGDNAEFKVEEYHSKELGDYFQDFAEQQRRLHDLFDSFWF